MASYVYFKILKCCEIFATLIAGDVHAGRWLEADWGVGKRFLIIETVINAKQCWSLKVKGVEMFG